MDTTYGDLDVFAVEQTKGVPPSFAELRERAVQLNLGDLTVRVAEDLIRMKTAAAEFRDRPEAKRQQDREDIAVLERLRAEELKRRSADRDPPARGTPGREPPH